MAILSFYTAADCGRSDLLSGMARQFAAGTTGSCIAALCTGQHYSQPIPVEQYTSSNLELIAALSAQIGSQSGRAEESSRQFVSNVSHELRTPMTIISGFVEGILDGTVPKNKRMEYLSIVSQEVQRLKMLVTSMLNLTKFDAGTIQLNYRMFILNDTAFRTILMFENRLEKRHISVEGLDGEPVRVCADPDLIGQVVYNLVENAVKFVNDGGTISFTFADEEDCWVFAVRNTGNGISKKNCQKSLNDSTSPMPPAVRTKPDWGWGWILRKKSFTCTTHRSVSAVRNMPIRSSKCVCRT